MISIFSQNNLPEPETANASIRVIGPPGSGKTTYMAALARWPNANPKKSAIQSVIPLNDYGRELVTKAQNILEKGDQLEKTDLDNNINDLKDYALSIVLKDQVSWRNLNNNSRLRININCKDYAGEFLKDLIFRPGSNLLQDYMKSCVESNGIILLVDGMSREDQHLANGLEQFLRELDQADMTKINRRIAVVINKCEQSALWINRHDPRLITEAHFPQMMRKLDQWETLGRGIGMVDYFTVSAFGTVGKRYPTANVKNIGYNQQGISSYLDKPDSWKPFGLVSPIYWLSTGKRYQLLDQE